MEFGVRDPWNPDEAFVPECPSCAGKLDESAKSLLSWAKMSARTRVESGFAELAQVRDTVERHSSTSGSYLALTEFLRGIQGSFSEQDLTRTCEHWLAESERDGPRDESDEEPLPPGIEEVGPEEKALIERIRSTVKSPSGRNKPHPEAGKARCCVEEFRTWGPYGPEIVDAPAVVDGKTTLISAAEVEFTFNMRYSDKGVCECDCCEYRQWILADEITTRTAPSEPQPQENGVPEAPPDTPTTTHGAKEDCYWMVWDPARGKYRYARADSKPVPLAGTPEDKPVLGPYCFGNKEHEEESTRLTGMSASQVFSEENCKLLVVDRPAQGTPPPSWMIWHAVFAGVIYDACRNWTIVRAAEVDFTVEAYFTKYTNESWAEIKKD